MDDSTLGSELRRLRCANGYSLREFAEVAHHSKSLIWDWEAGKSTPTPDETGKLDALLKAGGTLSKLQCAASEPSKGRELERESERLAQQLAAVNSGELITVLERGTDELAVEYLKNPGAALIDEVTAARREAYQAMRRRRVRNHHQMRYLTADIGYLSGILAYAALDDGHPEAALTHANVAWQAGEIVGSDQLLAWVRGTQSLILRFMQRYPEARERAEDGLRYASTGTARARLLAGVGQSYANMADPRAVRRALRDAEVAFDVQKGDDELAGLFAFSRAKLMYYSGSSLIWLDGGDDARLARDQAHAAIRLWGQGGADRSVADEALAHVYAATAALQLHDLEAAEADLEPILSLPGERRISWISKRMDRITDLLDRPPFDTDPQARDLRERIAAYR